MGHLICTDRDMIVHTNRVTPASLCSCGQTAFSRMGVPKQRHLQHKKAKHNFFVLFLLGYFWKWNKALNAFVPLLMPPGGDSKMSHKQLSIFSAKTVALFWWKLHQTAGGTNGARHKVRHRDSIIMFVFFFLFFFRGVQKNRQRNGPQSRPHLISQHKRAMKHVRTHLGWNFWITDLGWTNSVEPTAVMCLRSLICESDQSKCDLLAYVSCCPGKFHASRALGQMCALHTECR